MTTVAWDGKLLAADRMATSGSYSFPVTKVHRLSTGGLFGFAGYAADGWAVKEWLESGRGVKPTLYDAPSFAAILVHPDGSASRLEETLVPYPIDAPHALGSGGDYARFAMILLNKDARKAVDAASQLDTYTGPGVDVVSLEP